MSVRIVTVDAFTDRPYAGNPAAVCVLPEARPDEWMRNVAREMNLSETAFLVPRGDAFHLRWLTPAVEVDLCGHATIACSHVLWEDGHLPNGAQARYDTRSGRLLADKRGDWIELDFPVKIAAAAEPSPGLLPALGIAKAVWIGKNAFDYFVEVDSEETLRSLKPNHSELRKEPVRGVIVTARGHNGFDFVSRFFAPGSGIDEDPVTGSAHTALAPYWAEKLGKTEMTGFQASARGGIVRVRMAGDRVILGGQAVTILRAELLA
jgi:predicted PhzF superfamily epimerase YddE/YHI9